MMIGKQYLKYFPKEVARLETGLTLYKSVFKSVDGSNGIISGPHKEFTKIDRLAHFACNERSTYFSESSLMYDEYSTRKLNAPILESRSFDKTVDLSFQINKACSHHLHHKQANVFTLRKPKIVKD